METDNLSPEQINSNFSINDVNLRCAISADAVMHSKLYQFIRVTPVEINKRKVLEDMVFQ